MYRIYIDMTGGRQLGLPALLSILMASVMRVLNVLVLGLVSVLVLGCESNPPKPELSESQYQEYSQRWAYIHVCNRLGYISPEVAAAGVKLHGQVRGMYDINDVRFDSMANQTSKRPVSKETCNQVALYIHSNTPKNHNNTPDDAFLNRPLVQPSRTTYCNQVGTQTLCNTF